MDNSAQEKRTAQRVQCNFRAVYESNEASFDVWCADLSRNGMFIRTDFLEKTGVTANLYLYIPGQNTPLLLKGEVKRVDTRPLSSGMGISFQGIDDDSRRTLAQFLIERSFSSLN